MDTIANINLKVLNLPHAKDLQHITPNEVWKIIKVLPRKIALGSDHIPNTALQISSKSTILYIKKIFNSCLRLEYFPTPSKHATVVMIPKSEKNYLTPTNHWPISLLNIIAKLFEIIILNRVKKISLPL